MSHPRLDRAALVLALAATGGAVVALATTSRETYVAPSVLALATAVAIAACATVAPERYRGAASVAAALACGAAAGHVLAHAGAPRVHDLQHLWGVWAYGRAVGEGSIWPTWIPYIGAGIPLLPFYGPANFLLALPGILAGLAPVGAWKLALFQGHVLSALSMLAAARLLGASWRGALLAAVALAFAPWRLAVFDYRGALGEANAFLFTPLVAASALRLLRGPSRAASVALAAATGALALTHLQTLLTLGIALLPVLAIEWLGRKEEDRAPARGRLARLATLAAPVALGLGLTAFVWVPALIESKHVSIDETTRDNPYYRYTEQGIAPHELFERERWDRPRFSLPESIREREGLEGEQMPFYVGAILVFVAAGLGVAVGDRRTSALVAGVTLALGLATSWLAGMGDWLPGLATLRFPWRFLAPASVLAALAWAVGFDAWCRGRSERTAAAATLALVVLVVGDGAPYTGAADRIPPYLGAVHWHAADPRIAHWAEQMTPVALDLPRDGAVRRVHNLELPPNDYTTSIDWFYPGYYEWLTPTVYREYWRTNDPARHAEAGVALSFASTSPTARQLPARPYASFERDGRPIGGEVHLIDRLPGRIRVQAIAPEPGATLVVREQSFPGWRVRIDRQAPAAPREVRGFLAVDLTSGEHTIELRYGAGTWPRRAGIVLSLLALGAAGLWLRR